MKDSKTVSLFINSATKALEFALSIGNEYQKIDMGDPKKALERSHLGIQSLLDDQHITLKDVDNFYVLLGPGSNTGIRLGLTICKTVYAFNKNVRLYGIPTMTLMTYAGADAVLSDRNTNLFYGHKENNVVSFEKVNKNDIANKITEKTIVVEEKDVKAQEALKNHDFIKIDIVDMMVRYQGAFTNYSYRDEDFLPEYLSKI